VVRAGERFIQLVQPRRRLVGLHNRPIFISVPLPKSCDASSSQTAAIYLFRLPSSHDNTSSATAVLYQHPHRCTSLIFLRSVFQPYYGKSTSRSTSAGATSRPMRPPTYVCLLWSCDVLPWPGLADCDLPQKSRWRSHIEAPMGAIFCLPALQPKGRSGSSHRRSSATPNPRGSSRHRAMPSRHPPQTRRRTLPAPKLRYVPRLHGRRRRHDNNPM
jgi:hypothetical protein